MQFYFFCIGKLAVKPVHVTYGKIRNTSDQPSITEGTCSTFLPMTFSPRTTLLFMLSTDSLTLVMQLMAATSLETFWINNFKYNWASSPNYLFISGSQALSFASSLTVHFNISKKKKQMKIYLPCCNWNLSQKYNIFSFI